jgi:hypothetical protein
MKSLKDKTIRLMFGASLAALSLGAAAQAQTAPKPAPAPDKTADAATDTQEVIVVGVRKSEQSAINRKKHAATAQDSIVADDIGKFPDKDAAAAISRIAGVGLDTADDGTPGGFTIRGQAADLVRVEVDGMTMLPTGNQDGRTASVVDMSSDLIKSVDVVKGATADMTPGGVGGTVRIQQRTGLDFNKPLLKFNLQYQRNSLNGQNAPRVNLVATRKFMNGKLGLLFNFTYDDQETTFDFARVSDKNSGYIPLGDQDNSAGRSFKTPYDAAAAAITTKAGCATLPTPTAANFNSRLTCYAQWEDFVPSLPRFSRNNLQNKRTSAQFRADYKVNNNLTVFVSYNPNILDYRQDAANLQIASPTGSTNASGVLATNIRNTTVNANHFVTSYDMTVSSTSPLPVGFVSSLNWSSQIRDIKTSAQQHYIQTGADFKWKKWVITSRLQYSLAKSERRDEAFTFVAPIPSATFKMIPGNGLWTFSVPSTVDLSNPAAYYPIASTTTGLSANSQLEYTPQADRNTETNFQTDATRRFDHFGPIQDIKFGLQYRDRYNTTWREGGFDIAPGVTLYRARSLDQLRFCVPSLAPASAPCQFGTSYTSPTNTAITDRLYKTYTMTQAQYQDIINTSLEDLPGAQFFHGLPDRGNLLNGWKVFDFDTFFAKLGQVGDLSGHNPQCLYTCLATDGKTYSRPSYSTTEDTFSSYIMTDFETKLFNMTLNGNAGVRYQRIHVLAHPSEVFFNRVAVAGTTTGGLPTYTFQDTLVSRRVTEIDRTSEDILPSINLTLWPIDDQVAVRYSIAKQRARPSMAQLTGTSSASCFKVNDADRTALEAFLATHPGAIDDGDATTDDASESSNFISSYVNRCTSTIGNPDLKGYAATVQNLSLEWYPNKDSQLSAAVYKIYVKSGRPEAVTLPLYELEGSNYLVSTYQDGQSGLTQKGFELAGRTAFTFLPWAFKYTGGGFNYTTTTSNAVNADVDEFTGLALPPKGQSAYVYNVNLWYDDGRLSARVAYQYRDFYYTQTDRSPSINRIPNTVGNGSNTTGYYKTISPIFKSASKSLDARISYKANKTVEIFLEGKNLLNDSVTRYTPDTYRQVGDGTPYVFDTYYAGRTIYFGLSASF